MIKRQFFEQLAPWQQISFCLGLAERMYPNYALFSEGTGFGDTEVFRKVLDLFWEQLIVKGSKINFEILQEKFEPEIPDVENFDMYGVYPALDACVVVTCLFNLQLLKKPEGEAFNASQTSIATVASFIEATSEMELSDDAVMEDELMQQELAFQQALLDTLDEQRSPDFLKQVRKFAKNEGISNIGIGLE